MKKKTLSLALALVMCLGLTVPAFAAQEDYFSKNGLTVLPEPPKDQVAFSFVNYDNTVEKENAYFKVEQGKCNVEGISVNSSNKDGYQTITLTMRYGMFVTRAPEMDQMLLLGCSATDGLYDYYTGQELRTGYLSGNSSASNTIQVTYGGKTYDLEYDKNAEWNQEEWYYDEESGRMVSPFSCRMIYTITAPIDYDGLVCCIGNRTSLVLDDSDDAAISYADNENNPVYFRFGPKAAGQPVTPTQPETPTAPTVTVENIPASGTAKASSQTVTVDGKKVEFQMYALVDASGNGTNYIKLRDMAQVLNGTKAQFSVGYDGTISLTTGQAYTSTGTEMTTPFSGDRSYTGGARTVKINGSNVDMTAITLLDDAGGGYNYFKLRDLGKALGFNVGYSNERGVFIESDKPYAG